MVFLWITTSSRILNSAGEMAQNIVYLDDKVAELDAVALAKLLSLTADVEAACEILDEQLNIQGNDLLSVKFCDLMDEKPAIRPFGRYPRVVSEMATELRQIGGCPISREAQLRLRPFDAMEIEKSAYPDFLSARFLQELKKMDHKHIAVIPIILGRGLGVFTVGLNEQRFEGRKKDALVNFICAATSCLVSHFPEVSTIFETKKLFSMESQCVLLCSNGHTDAEIGKVMNLSEITVAMILSRAAEKLGAKSRAHLVSKALAAGEISNMQSSLS